jgi:hypothetical protein
MSVHVAHERPRELVLVEVGRSTDVARSCASCSCANLVFRHACGSALEDLVTIIDEIHAVSNITRRATVGRGGR